MYCNDNNMYIEGDLGQGKIQRSSAHSCRSSLARECHLILNFQKLRVELRDHPLHNLRRIRSRILVDL